MELRVDPRENVRVQVRQYVGKAERAAVDSGKHAGLVKAAANIAGALAFALTDLADAIRDGRHA